MDGSELIHELKRKNGFSRDVEVAKYLDMNQVSISQWRKGDYSLTPKKIASAIERASRSAIKNSRKNLIRPIVEFFPVNTVASQRGTRLDLFPASRQARQASA